jgi:hypothetical protein
MRYWRTPPELLDRIKKELGTDQWFDPCPCPRPEGYDSLKIPWKNPTYCNPPFRKKDSPDGGPTAFVRKAIEENKLGKTVALVLPTQSYVNLLLEAGATAHSVGRVKWLEADTGKPSSSPSPITLFILKG